MQKRDQLRSLAKQEREVSHVIPFLIICLRYYLIHHSYLCGIYTFLSSSDLLKMILDMMTVANACL